MICSYVTLNMPHLPSISLQQMPGYGYFFYSPPITKFFPEMDFQKIFYSAQNILVQELGLVPDHEFKDP